MDILTYVMDGTTPVQVTQASPWLGNAAREATGTDMDLDENYYEPLGLNIPPRGDDPQSP